MCSGRVNSSCSTSDTCRFNLLIRYSRACGSYQDFLDRGLLLTRKLLNQGFLLVKLKSSLRTFHGHHHFLVTRTPLKTGGELRCSGRVSSSFSTSGTRRVNLVTNPVISREWRTNREVEHIRGYLWHRYSITVNQEMVVTVKVFSGVRVTRSLVLYVCFVDCCLSFLCFFFWPLCSVIMITPLVSSTSSVVLLYCYCPCLIVILFLFVYIVKFAYC
jgi:hypothetical protein